MRLRSLIMILTEDTEIFVEDCMRGYKEGTFYGVMTKEKLRKNPTWEVWDYGVIVFDLKNRTVVVDSEETYIATTADGEKLKAKDEDGEVIQW